MTTNDPDKPTINLTIIGEVEIFVTINPQRINLRGPTGKLLIKTATIIPADNYPFKIIDARVNKGEHISIFLKKKFDNKLKGYILTVQNRRKKKGRYFDTIILYTDSNILPTIEIPVIGNII